MTTADKPLTEFSIDRWRVLPERGLIESDGKSVHLEPKVMEVLLALADGGGGVVSKDVLVEKVWDGRAVSDVVITRCISVLRGSLEDDPRNPRFIETLPKRGYRLLPRVVATSATRQSLLKSRRGSRWSLTALLVLVTSGVAYWSLNPRKTEPPVSTNTIAVLPFVNLSGPEQQYLCDGISEQLIVTLAENSALKVVARTSSNSFRDSKQDIRDIARELGVGAIIEGSVRRAGNTVRVSAQLIDSESGYELWSGSYDEAIEDTFDVQERISKAIAASVQTNGGMAAPAQTLTSRPRNFAAYDKFLLARYTQNQRRAKGLEESILMFEQSISLDPNYGPSYLGLAYTYALLPSYLAVDAAKTYEKALVTLDAGIAADPHIAGVGAGVRGFLHLKRGEWLASEEQFQRALQSRYVEPTSYLWYSQLLATVGRRDRSLDLALLGREIDPLSPVANSRLAIAYLWLGENAQAQHYFDIANALDIDSAVHNESSALLLLREGRYVELEGISAQLPPGSGDNIGWFTDLVAARNDSSKRSSALTKISGAIEQGQIAPRIGVVSLALLGATDEAANMLLTQVELGKSFEYELLFIDELAAVRQHPLFPTIIDRLGLAEYWQVRGCSWENERLRCD